MNNADVDLHLAQCRAELDHVQATIGTVGVMSPVTPYLTRYAVIRACGAIEVSFKSLIADFCTKRSKKQIKRFIHLKIRKGSANPSQENIMNILNQFDEDWKRSFKSNLKADPNKQKLLDSLQSLVDARNDFAHGGSPTLTISDVIQHFDHARRVVEYVDAVVV
jgi:hypothetical protein